MNLRSIHFFFGFAFLFVPFLSGQTADFERILVPIVICNHAIPGAFGSLWTTRLAITNTATGSVSIFGYDPYPSGCIIAVCPPVGRTPPGITFFPIVCPGSASQGAIVQVERQYAASVAFQLHVQDVSRQSETWGTEIPVVRESGLRRSAFQLLDVPLTAEFRSTLRLYDIDARPAAQARVRFYRVNSATHSPLDLVVAAPLDALVVERTISLSVERRGADPAYDVGYAELSNLGSLPELSGTDRLRIEVQPLTPDLRLWAFISTTNNVTQHVTTITPQ
jgi:hypothetical protein